MGPSRADIAATDRGRKLKWSREREFNHVLLAISRVFISLAGLVAAM